MNREEMKAVFLEVMEEEREKHWIDPKTHHEHHHFLKGWVWAVCIMKKSAIIAFVGGVITGLLVVAWTGIKALIAIKGVVVG